MKPPPRMKEADGAKPFRWPAKAIGCREGVGFRAADVDDGAVNLDPIEPT